MFRSATNPWQGPSLLPLLMALAVIGLGTPCVEASVIPRPPKIILLPPDDFPEMVFVVYRLKADNPWAKGPRVDPASPKIVPAGTVVPLPYVEQYEFAVLAVPSDVAEKAKGKPDPAWLGPSAPRIIHVPESFRVPGVYRDVTLRYRLENVDKEPRLVLLNREDLRAAKQMPSEDTSAEVAKPQPLFLTQPLFLWGLIVGGGLGLVIGACFAWRFKRVNVTPAGNSLT
jgi:hypothetical protein